MTHPYQNWQARRSLLLLLLIIVINGCGQWQNKGIQNRTIEAPMSVISTPPGDYGGMAWIGDWLVILIHPPEEQTFFSGQLWQLHPNGSQATRLNIPLQPGCDRQGVQAPTRLPDSRLGYILRCAANRTSNLNDLYLMAYDMETARATRLRSYPLPSQQVGTGGYSWDPTMERGITSDGNGRGLYEQLYWLNQDRPTMLGVGVPQAFAATWAPDGSTIAFLGAPEQGLSGTGRADASFNLYLMTPEGIEPHVVFSGLHYVASLAWSPDSNWMVLPASLSTDRREKAVWLIERNTGNYRQIAQGDFAAPVWSPNGQRVALFHYSGEYPNAAVQLVILDVAALLHSP